VTDGDIMSCVDIPQKQVAEFCRRRHIRKLALFGSAVRGELRPDSDIDVLVRFEPDQVIGLDIMDIEEELSRILGGRNIDLVNEKYINPRLRSRILAEAEVQYGS